ncbi:hypothetical protein PoB_004134400 [Plakobranchus ocellatus]|uniref:Uncharacterized protein n=1 Tax=Plakobranchus ocellatus TaxID=259542 RepID=A0AAV4B445_9GAST|nr:hypothetical protein PoB_004134400 [Plakobranchus ocellatus]
MDKKFFLGYFEDVLLNGRQGTENRTSIGTFPCKSLPCMPSHYCEKTNKEYPGPELKLEYIYHFYSNDQEDHGCKSVGEATYKMNFFNDFNLACHVLSKSRWNFYENYDANEKFERKDEYAQFQVDNDAAQRQKMPAKPKQKQVSVSWCCYFDIQQILLTSPSTEKTLYCK